MNRHRNLLLLLKQDSMSPGSMEIHVEILHRLLSRAEGWPNVSSVYEVMDMVRYRKIRKPHQVRTYLKTKFDAPFLFFINRN